MEWKAKRQQVESMEAAPTQGGRQASCLMFHKAVILLYSSGQASLMVPEKKSLTSLSNIPRAPGSKLPRADNRNGCVWRCVLPQRKSLAVVRPISSYEHQDCSAEAGVTGMGAGHKQCPILGGNTSVPLPDTETYLHLLVMFNRLLMQQQVTHCIVTKWQQWKAMGHGWMQRHLGRASKFLPCPSFLDPSMH